MILIVRTLFNCLHGLDPNVEEAKLRVNDEELQHREITMSISAEIPSNVTPDDPVLPTDTSFAPPPISASAPKPCGSY